MTLGFLLSLAGDGGRLKGEEMGGQFFSMSQGLDWKRGSRGRRSTVILVGRRRATLSQTQQRAISLCHKSLSLPSHSQACSVPAPGARIQMLERNSKDYSYFVLEVCSTQLSIRWCRICIIDWTHVMANTNTLVGEISTLIPSGTTKIL